MLQNKLALRRLLITIHLYAAGFLAPIFIVVGLTGALYIMGAEPETTARQVTLPADAKLDLSSPSLEDDVRSLLSETDVDVRFGYLRVWDGGFQTRPTSRAFVEVDVTEEGMTATYHRPGLYFALLELHKGHGPELFRLYQILSGIGMLIVVLGGIAVGLLAPAYQKVTLGASAVGLVGFILLGFLV